MAEAATGSYPGHITLSEFLDTLPKTPCEQTPKNRYFCTVCERLNKGVAARCNYSNFEPEEGSDQSDLEGGRVQFIHVPEGPQPPEKLAGSTGPEGSERVEFKVIAPFQNDDDYPMLELVQPKDKKVKPIEMELLEDVAIEFTVSDDEAVEVEALEVEPLGDTDEELDEDETTVDLDAGNAGDAGDALEVEALEVEILDDTEKAGDTDIMESAQALPQFKPLEDKKEPIAEVETITPIPTPTPTPIPTPTARPGVKRKSVKKAKVPKKKKIGKIQQPPQPSFSSSPTQHQMPRPQQKAQPKQPQQAPRPMPMQPRPRQMQPRPTAAQPQAIPQNKMPIQQHRIMQPKQQSMVTPPRSLQPISKKPPKKLKKIVRKKE